MFDYIIMGGILIFLLFILLFKAKLIHSGNNTFFDQQNSKAMRGFWCLIVLLVHIPQAYQNTIQDMLGSFAYIGVTFFFMTSAYGLSVSIHKKPESINNFWLVRLPKLIVPNLLTNIVFLFLLFILECSSNVDSILSINPWIKFLLCCYIAFWIGYRYNAHGKHRQQLICTLVFTLSISTYITRYMKILSFGTWCTEILGFVWGIILFAQHEKIKEFFLRKWIIKAAIACSLSLILGTSYLLLKNTIFWGDYLLKIILGLSILCFILIINAKIKIGNKISFFLGDISFEIYLTHGYVFHILEKISPDISSGVFILISIILTVLFSAIIHSICNLLLKLCILKQ